MHTGDTSTSESEIDEQRQEQPEAGGNQLANIGGGRREGAAGAFVKSSSNASLEARAYALLAGAPGICPFVAQEGDDIILSWYPINLDAYVSSGGEFEAKWVDQLVFAVGEMHRRGVVHGNICPVNIMLDDNHNAFITDMDSCIIDGDYREHEENAKIGTFPYMSVEYYRTQQATEGEDWFSLGCTFWFCLVGEPPFYEVNFLEDDTLPEVQPQETLGVIPAGYRDIIKQLWDGHMPL